MKDIIKTTVTLLLITSLVSAILGAAEAITREPIAAQAKKTQTAAMSQVMAQATEFNEISTDVSGRVQAVYEGVNSNGLCGYIVKLSAKGYGGAIDMIVGISTADNTMTGMRILKHNETPGLGANATKDYFYANFENIPLHTLSVVKSSPREYEVEAITSSTITTRAVVETVNEAMNWYNGGAAK